LIVASFHFEQKYRSGTTGFAQSYQNFAKLWTSFCTTERVQRETHHIYSLNDLELAYFYYQLRVYLNNNASKSGGELFTIMHLFKSPRNWTIDLLLLNKCIITRLQVCSLLIYLPSRFGQKIAK